MLVALTVRKLKPGSYDAFRAAWEGDGTPPPEGWVRAYHVRNVNDPDEVISFGFFDGSLEELRAGQTAEDYAGVRRKTAEFEEAIGADGLYEVLEELTPETWTR
jgi:hypothetical protein